MRWNLSLQKAERYRGGQGTRGKNESEETLRWSLLYQQETQAGKVEEKETGADEKEGGRSLVLALISWNIVTFNILYQKNKKIIHSNTAFSGV